LVLTVYTTGPKIQRAVEQHPSDRVEAIPCADLADAVRRGFDWARPGGVVLLSPAAASFDAFDDYRHRARAFGDAIADLPDRPDTGPSAEPVT
jgi:UDP-N-acetylmuramoylalanine--D-glutamate ligase